MLWPPEPPGRITGVGEDLFTERELLPEQSLGLLPPTPGALGQERESETPSPPETPRTHGRWALDSHTILKSPSQACWVRDTT